jgi:hypothetical protein
MDTGPLCSNWNCGSEFSGDIRHLKDRAQEVGRKVDKGCVENQDARKYTGVIFKGI